ncbi:chromate efflux transporter [Dyella sp. BiH032]|uniref:chromate efflux transporter n=1 Tax=Dyella sp. BiH032 TaxID=3075430 RepID=UPI002892F990|nr:chromate efflux transporter [Dyella sp. BiH032]WNL44710.1 chromate efflux transporter [Dyella sp. BiH032]
MDPTPPPTDALPFREAIRVWAKIGLLSFGGPAGQIAVMHRELVEKRRWISDARFLHALNYCMLLPGPEATQLAIYVGWLLHRTIGGLLAGLLFVLPGVLTMLALSVVYALFGKLPLVAAVFFGLKAAVLAVVVEAVLRIGRKALKNGLMVAVAAVAFVAIRFFAVPFPLIVMAAGLFGFAGRWWWPRFFPANADAQGDAGSSYLVDRWLAQGRLAHVRPSGTRAMRIAVVGIVLWLAPIALVAFAFGGGSLLARQGMFFAQTSVVTFGGAYAVLAYVAQRAVEGFHWITPGQMLDGLALAETTPGPLIMVLQFVGFLAAYQHESALSPMAAGVLGSLLTTWVTFAPSFMFIFLGAPYIEALRGNRALHAALSAITAAIVGVILNLSVWFALHTLFGSVSLWRLGPLALEIPRWDSLQVSAALLTAAALVAMLHFRIGMAWTLLGAGTVGAVLPWIAGHAG